jgi:excisionase family DNA binding protein
MEQRAVSLNHRSNAKRTPDRELISYTLKEAARITGLSVSTIRRHHGSGRLRFFRVGGRTLVDGASLRRLLGVEE